jgi:hypothetical protein
MKAPETPEKLFRVTRLLLSTETGPRMRQQMPNQVMQPGARLRSGYELAALRHRLAGVVQPSEAGWRKRSFYALFARV